MKKNILLTLALLSLTGTSSINAGAKSFFGGYLTGSVTNQLMNNTSNNNNRGCPSCHCPDVTRYKNQIASLNEQISDLKIKQKEEINDLKNQLKEFKVELKTAQNENRGHQKTIGKHEGTIARLEKKLEKYLG